MPGTTPKSYGEGSTFAVELAAVVSSQLHDGLKVSIERLRGPSPMGRGVILYDGSGRVRELFRGELWHAIDFLTGMREALYIVGRDPLAQVADEMGIELPPPVMMYGSADWNCRCTYIRATCDRTSGRKQPSPSCESCGGTGVKAEPIASRKAINYQPRPGLDVEARVDVARDDLSGIVDELGGRFDDAA